MFLRILWSVCFFWFNFTQPLCFHLWWTETPESAECILKIQKCLTKNIIKMSSMNYHSSSVNVIRKQTHFETDLLGFMGLTTVQQRGSMYFSHFFSLSGSELSQRMCAEIRSRFRFRFRSSICMKTFSKLSLCSQHTNTPNGPPALLIGDVSPPSCLVVLLFLLLTQTHTHQHTRFLSQRTQKPSGNLKLGANWERRQKVITSQTSVCVCVRVCRGVCVCVIPPSVCHSGFSTGGRKLKKEKARRKSGREAPTVQYGVLLITDGKCGITPLLFLLLFFIASLPLLTLKIWRQTWEESLTLPCVCVLLYFGLQRFH